MIRRRFLHREAACAAARFKSERCKKISRPMGREIFCMRRTLQSVLCAGFRFLLRKNGGAAHLEISAPHGIL